VHCGDGTARGMAGPFLLSRPLIVVAFFLVCFLLLLVQVGDLQDHLDSLTNAVRRRKSGGMYPNVFLPWCCWLRHTHAPRTPHGV